MLVHRGDPTEHSSHSRGQKEEREKPLRETEALQPQRMTENCQECLGCDSKRFSETSREKHREPRSSVETQLSCYSGVDETTLGGTFSMDEIQHPFTLYCTEETDSDSSYYDCEDERHDSDVEEGRKSIKSGSAYVRNSEAINVDCLSPENIKHEQDQQPEIQMITQWKRDDTRPKWSQEAKYGPELKAYWSSWESLILMDEALYKKKPINVSVENKLRIVLPLALRKKCFTFLHDTVTSAHLGSQKTREKVKQRFYWYECRKDVEYWCRTCDISASRKSPNEIIQCWVSFRKMCFGYPRPVT